MTLRDIINRKRGLPSTDHIFVKCTVCGEKTEAHILDSAEFHFCSDDCLEHWEESQLADRIDAVERLDDR